MIRVVGTGSFNRVRCCVDYFRSEGAREEKEYKVQKHVFSRQIDNKSHQFSAFRIFLSRLCVLPNHSAQLFTCYVLLKCWERWCPLVRNSCLFITSETLIRIRLFWGDKLPIEKHRAPHLVHRWVWSNEKNFRFTWMAHKTQYKITLELLRRDWDAFE